MELKAKFMPFWGKYLQMIEDLSEEDAGHMIKAMARYYFRNVEPEDLPSPLNGFWYFARMDIDDARNSYEQKVLSGQKGGERSAQVRRQKAEEKQKEALSSTSKQDQLITKTESKTRTRTKTGSITNTDTGCAQPPDGGVSVQKHTFGEFGWVKLTPQEYQELETQWGREELLACIAYVDESAQSTGNRNRWKDWALILKKCHRDRWHETKQFKTTSKVPMGATGHLGDAELEAIQRVLKTDIPPVVLPGEMGNPSPPLTGCPWGE